MENELSVEEKKDVKSKIIDDLRAEDIIQFAYLHGSFLKGEFNDIDLAVYISEKDFESMDKKRYWVLS